MYTRNAVRETRESYPASMADAPPTDPGIKGKVVELLKYLDEAELEQRTLRESLFGSSPEAGANETKSTHEPGTDELLMRACHQAACLVGEAKSINARL